MTKEFKTLSEKIDMIKVDKFGIILDTNMITVRNVKEFIKRVLEINHGSSFASVREKEIKEAAGDKLI